MRQLNIALALCALMALTALGRDNKPGYSIRVLRNENLQGHVVLTVEITAAQPSLLGRTAKWTKSTIAKGPANIYKDMDPIQVPAGTSQQMMHFYPPDYAHRSFSVRLALWGGTQNDSGYSARYSGGKPGYQMTDFRCQFDYNGYSD